MLKAHGIISSKNIEDLDKLKEVLLMDLADSNLVDEVKYFRDRVTSEGSARSDITLVVKASETGKYPKGTKKKIKEIIGTYTEVLIHF